MMSDVAWPPTPLSATTTLDTAISTPPPLADPTLVDPTREGCNANWCDPGWPTQHCAYVEECGTCTFCELRVGCSGEWCSPDFAAEHCASEDCSNCAFCGSLQEFSLDATAPEQPEMCAEWCDGSLAHSHCADARCTDCGFCASRTGDGDVDARAAQHSCADWCSRDSMVSHCSDAEQRCSGCAGWDCEAAVAYQCEPWCSAENKVAHCKDGLQRCRGCAFGCEELLAAAAVRPHSLETLSNEVTTKEAHTAAGVRGATPAGGLVGTTAAAKACGDWCDAQHAHIHCELGACADCAFCALRPLACDSYCAHEHAVVHCKQERCHECGFCRSPPPPPPSPSPPQPVPRPSSPSPLPPKPASSTPPTSAAASAATGTARTPWDWEAARLAAPSPPWHRLLVPLPPPAPTRLAAPELAGGLNTAAPEEWGGRSAGGGGAIRLPSGLSLAGIAPLALCIAGLAACCWARLWGGAGLESKAGRRAGYKAAAADEADEDLEEDGRGEEEIPAHDGHESLSDQSDKADSSHDSSDDDDGRQML